VTCVELFRSFVLLSFCHPFFRSSTRQMSNAIDPSTHLSPVDHQINGLESPEHEHPQRAFLRRKIINARRHIAISMQPNPN
ncbi:hypothetical protein ACLOJK_000476, partial [Asimina triloba]